MNWLKKLFEKKKPDYIKGPNNKQKSTALVKDDDLKKHIFVEEIFKMVDDYEAYSREMKKSIYDKLDEYKQYMAGEYGVSSDFKSITLTNFTQDKRIEQKTGDLIDFNDNINIAQKKIEEVIDSELKYSKAGSTIHVIAELATSAFTVKHGRLNRNALLALTRMNIQNKTFEEAQKIILESMVTTETRQYINFKKKDDKGKYRAVNLNFSSLDI